MWVSLVVLLPLFWKGITGQNPLYTIDVASSVSVQEGLCVTIPCKFTADGRNTFRNSLGYWRHHNAKYYVATNDKSITVQTNFHLTGNPDSGDCSLTLTKAKKDDEGGYYFRFQDYRGRYSYLQDTTKITVTGLTEEPVISDVGTLIAGVRKTLTCAPPGNCSATSLRFQWTKSNDPGIWKTSSTITFTPSIDDDQETITCEMTNIQGTTTQNTILLHVYNPFHITITWNISGKKINNPDPIKVDEGSSIALTCLVESTLTLDVIWTDEKNNILQKGTGKELELKLENIMMTQAGIYTCTAKNEYVKKSANINITVQYSFTNMKITIISSKGGERPSGQPVVIDASETLTLVCRVDANPNATVAWVKGEVDTESPKTNNSVSSAMINVTLSTSDVYRCLAWNAFGFRERRIQVGEKNDNITRTMDYTFIIGMVIGNVAALILVNMGTYFFLKKHMKKRYLEGAEHFSEQSCSTKKPPPTDPVLRPGLDPAWIRGKKLSDRGTQETESTYEELTGQKSNVYCSLNVR